MTEGPGAAWTRCRPYIEAALVHAGGGYEIGDVAAGIEAGRFHFWPGAHCAVVTEFVDAPHLKALNFWLLGGDLRELLTMRPHIEAWAKAQDCRRVIGGGVFAKRGWARVLASFDYRPMWTIYGKDLG